MKQIKYNGQSVFPNPNDGGSYSDTKVPNCTETDRCLVRASKILGLATPTMTQSEIDSAVTANGSLAEVKKLIEKCYLVTDINTQEHAVWKAQFTVL